MAKCRPVSCGMDGKIHGTNGSQFFITTVPTSVGFDGHHHHLRRGCMDGDSKAVVDKLQAVNTDRMDRPTEPVGIVSVEVLKKLASPHSRTQYGKPLD